MSSLGTWQSDWWDDIYIQVFVQNRKAVGFYSFRDFFIREGELEGREKRWTE